MKLAIIDIVAIFTGVVAAIIISALTRSYWALVAMPATIAAATAIGSWIASGWVPGLPHFDASVISMLKFGGSVTGSNVIYYFARNGDNLLIGWKCGSTELGLYSKAYRLLMLPIDQILGPLSSVMIPMLSRLQSDPELYRRSFKRIYSAISLSVMPATAGFVALAHPLILVLLGPQWEESANIFAYLAIAAMYMPLAAAINWLFISQGRPHTMLLASAINSVLAVISFVVGLPYGAVGVAAAFAISGLLVRFPILVYLAGRQGPVSARDLLTVMAIHLPECLIVGAACKSIQYLLIKQPPIIQLISGLSAGALVVCIIILTMPKCRHEVNTIWRICQSALLRRSGPGDKRS